MSPYLAFAIGGCIPVNMLAVAVHHSSGSAKTAFFVAQITVFAVQVVCLVVGVWRLRRDW